MAEEIQETSSLETSDSDTDYWLVCLHEVAGCPAILRLIVEVPDDINAGELGDRVAVIWSASSVKNTLPTSAPCGGGSSIRRQSDGRFLTSLPS